MRATFIGHASILIETRGKRILSDPWWQGPCFGVQWWIYPKPCLEPVLSAPLDYIYISHGHHDHLHGGTLGRLNKDAKILVSSALDITPTLEKLGFTVIELDPEVQTEIAPGIKVEITPTHSGDTMMIVDDGDEICLNLNDAIHSAPSDVFSRTLHYLQTRYPQIDYLYCGYGIASHFPNCIAIPGKDPIASTVQRQKHFNRKWVDVVAALEPRMAFPFAADVVFYEDDLFWTNEPLHNAERPTDLLRMRFPSLNTTAVDMGPGLVVENGKVTHDVQFHRVVGERLKQERHADILVANKATRPTSQQVENLALLIRKNVKKAISYLRECSGNYNFLIQLREADTHITIKKAGRQVTVDTISSPVDTSVFNVVFTTRFSYLRRTLSVPYGNEVIFVGSGGIFEYRDRKDAMHNMHRELSVLLNKIESPPASRFGDQSKALFLLKTLVKRILGREEKDLYDVANWTVWEA